MIVQEIIINFGSSGSKYKEKITMKRQNIAIGLAVLTATVLFTACAARKTTTPASSDYVPPTLPSVRSAAESRYIAAKAAVSSETDDNAASEEKTKATQVNDNSAVQAQAMSRVQRMGQIYKQLAAAKEPDPVATVNGNPIARRDFDISKAEIEMSGTQKSNREILDQLIDNELWYEQAVKDGDTVSDASASSAISMEKKQSSEDSNSSKMIGVLMKDLGMTSEQFWAYMSNEYIQQMAIYNFQNKLMNDYQKKHTSSEIGQSMQDFQPYRDNLISQYRAKAKIVYFIA